VTRRSFTAAISSIFLLALAACQRRPRRVAFRFRMVVTVETPEGPRSADAVCEVAGIEVVHPVYGPGGSKTKLTGEALELQIPGRGSLLALVTLAHPTGGQDDLAFMAIKTLDPAYSGDRFESAERLADAPLDAAPREVPPPLYPLLLRMAGGDSVDSLELVDPRNLGQAFGAGVLLSSITVELSDLPVTLGIERRLAWLKSFENSLQFPSRALSGAETSVLVEVTSFSTEFRPWE
jgi:hypothetical protein